MPTLIEPLITLNAPIHTWFGIGGGADRFAMPDSVDQLRQCIQIDPSVRVLGDGANLLVDDDGVAELVVALTSPTFTSVRWSPSGEVRAGAGANLPKLINESVRLGLAGLEGLGGIPASLGGAVRMNAGGSFGQIADAVAHVHALDRAGREVTMEHADIGFAYRRSGLDELVITAIDLRLTPSDPKPLREKLREVMNYKKNSQPMADRSAGCVFKNPTLAEDLKDIGESGQRASAGMLIDLAGCKRMSIGGATVSPRHGNFIVTDPKTARARHVIDLMAQVARRVHEAFGVELVPEVVVWRRPGTAA